MYHCFVTETFDLCQECLDSGHGFEAVGVVDDEPLPSLDVSDPRVRSRSSQQIRLVEMPTRSHRGVTPRCTSSHQDLVLSGQPPANSLRHRAIMGAYAAGARRH